MKITITMKRTSPDGTVDLMDKTSDYETELWLMTVAAIKVEYNAAMEYSPNLIDCHLIDTDDEVGFTLKWSDGTVLEKKCVVE